MSHNRNFVIECANHYDHSRSHLRALSVLGTLERYLQCVLAVPSIGYSWEVSGKEYQVMAAFQGKTFAQVNIDASDAERFRTWWSTEQDHITDHTVDLLEHGYKLTVRYVVDQSAFCASLIGTDDTPANKNAILTSWSDDLAEVLGLTYFKHVILCDRQAWPTTDDGPRWG